MAVLRIGISVLLGRVAAAGSLLKVAAAAAESLLKAAVKRPIRMMQIITGSSIAGGKS